MNPLAVEIWLYILLAYLAVSLTIWIGANQHNSSSHHQQNVKTSAKNLTHQSDQTSSIRLFNPLEGFAKPQNVAICKTQPEPADAMLEMRVWRRSGSVLPGGVGQPPPLRRHRHHRPERLHARQQLLVCGGDADAAGLRPQPPGSLHQVQEPGPGHGHKLIHNSRIQRRPISLY